MTVFVSPFHARILRVALLPWSDVEQDWKVLREELDLDTLWEPDAMRMLPLLYRALVDAGVDDQDLPRLKGVVRRAWYDNLILFHAVGSALDALDAAGIPAMLLKGVPLALQCYPEVGLRPMADVDMLIEPWRAADAINVLGAAGWPSESKVTVPDALPYGEQMVHQVVCVNDANRQIDLHWRYVPWIARDGSGYDSGLWSAARRFDVAGHTALSPGPDDLLLLVLLHAFRAGWAATPRWIADATFALRAQGPELDWERFTHRVTEGHLALPVREALQFVADEFDAPVPSAALAALMRARVSPWARHRYHVASREITGERRAVIGELDDARIGWARWSINLTPAAAARSGPPFVARRLGLESTRDIPVAVTTRAARNLRAVLRGSSAPGAVQSESANS